SGRDVGECRRRSAEPAGAPAPRENGDDGPLAGPGDAAAAPLDWGGALRRLRARVGANRAKIEVLLIGGIALGGIVCMMAITIVVLIVQLRR
ncbi:MAG TPA: hypothetical protein VFI22_16570, partial [Thermomicrobiales bacterium]|nr:hypothetical protein [Thermomicrobiales bacterium]